MEPTSEVMQGQTVDTAAPLQDAGTQTQAASAAPEQPQEQTALGQPEQKDALPPDGLALDEDGELQFGDRFFDSFREPPAPMGSQQNQEPKAEQAPSQASEGQGQDSQAAATQPAGDYTPEELMSTPLEQIQETRFPEAMRPYLPVIRDYILGLHRQIGLLQGMQVQPPHLPQQAISPQAGQAAPQAPQATGPKEWAKAAQKLACERLGIPEGGIDCYDPEHVAALSMAAQDIAEQRRAETAQVQRSQQERQEFSRFSAELVGRPDFAEFDRWITDKLARAGMSSNHLYEYARQTGDIAGVHRTVAEMYQIWQGQKGVGQKTGGNADSATRNAPKVPVVESAGGTAQIKKSFDVKRLGELDEDEQARAFIEMGLV